MNLDRADMKLLIEAGYSGLMRGVDTKLSPIFEAINEWMPEYAAGEIGLALEEMVSSKFDNAERRLRAVLLSEREGRDEARAILAMCKVIQDQHEEARRLHDELSGTGSAAEAFTDLLVNGPPETTQGNQGLAMETDAMPAGDGLSAKQAYQMDGD